MVTVGNAEAKKERFLKTDAIGRTYEYDEHGNRLFKTPLHGSLRPPAIPLSEWQKLSKCSKQEVHDKWVATKEAMPIATPAAPNSGAGGSHPTAAGVRPQDFPHMPCTPVSIGHRQRDAQESPLYNACVARAVKPAEVKTNAKARAAMDTEWQRLRKVPRRDGKLGVWDEDAVQEWSSVRRDAQQKNIKANVGLIFGIVVEKNHELPEHRVRRQQRMG